MQNGDGNPHAQVSRLSIDVSDGIRRERSPPVFVALVDKQYPRRPNSKIKKIIECFWGENASAREQTESPLLCVSPVGA